MMMLYWYLGTVHCDENLPVGRSTVHTCRDLLGIFKYITSTRSTVSNQMSISFVVMSTYLLKHMVHLIHPTHLAFTLVKGILHSPIVAEQESFPQCAQQLLWPSEF